MEFYMRCEWIIDVLADLKAFAEHNGLAATAAAFEDSALVALAEISSVEARSPVADAMTARAEAIAEAGNVTPLFARRGLV